MTNEEAKALALGLLRADTEAEVMEMLSAAGLWDRPEAWRLYGDRDGNFSVIGNQQSRPEAALVEKIVNSVDARLMRECFSRGVEPFSDDAPQSIREAVARFVEGSDGPVGETGGALRFWSQDRQLEQAQLITLAVTGPTARKGSPSLTIADCGEGQTPDDMPDTFLSIDRENKLRIPFVQGKFNMGGTGALKFCGSEGLQCILSRRSADCPGSGERMHQWGFTVVRRVRPSSGAGAVRNSVYRYLAPVDCDRQPQRGRVLSFDAAQLDVLPHQNEPYARPLVSGSVLKLYEYDMKGFRSHALMKDGLLSRLEILLPGIALPVRVHECRDYRGVQERSFANTLVGFSARLENNRADSLEPGFPTSVPLRVAGENLTAEIYAFKRGRAEAYRTTEGIIFTVNGQTHGAIPKTFYGRKRVQMGRLGDSLLVVVDCSRLSVGSREDLFMNSRDRLSSGTLRKAIEEELEVLIGRHHGLKDLRERRRREEIADRLEDSKPLEEVLNSILKNSPTLSRLFLLGQRLNRPMRTSGNGTAEATGGDSAAFEGRPHPTFFRFAKKPQNHQLVRTAERGNRCRIKFETDVVNDYFSRTSVPGHYYVESLGGVDDGLDFDHSLTLHDGIANWSISIPDDLAVGQELTLQCTVTDDTLTEPFVNIAKITVLEPQTRDAGEGGRESRPNRDGTDPGGPGGYGGRRGTEPGGIQLPRIHKVKQGDQLWDDHGFDDRTGCKVVEDAVGDGPEDGTELTFYVNTSNVYFLTDLKGTRDDALVAEAKFVFGNVLVGLAVLHDSKNGSREGDEDNETESATQRVASITRALAPFLLPMIDYLGSLSPEEVAGLGALADEDA
jgi:hypothetical protein